MTSSDAWDVIVLGSGIAGLAGALAADELGLRPIVLEKASTLGGGTVNSYGLIGLARIIWRRQPGSSKPLNSRRCWRGRYRARITYAPPSPSRQAAFCRPSSETLL